MTPEEMKTVAKLADILRSKGVTRFIGAGIELDLGPLEAPIEATSKAAPEADMCRCGHPMYAHTNGGCIDGCPIENCVEAEKKETE